jgi:hypothetical protein
MFSSNNYHGAFQPRGIAEPGWQFTGNGDPSEVEKMKMVVTNDLRLLSLDRFLTEPIESLTPRQETLRSGLSCGPTKIQAGLRRGPQAGYSCMDYHPTTIQGWFGS